MKQITKGLMSKSLLTFIMIAFFQTIMLAQDGASESSGSTTTTKSVSVTSQSNDWYTSPWIWVVGAAVFILLLVALLRGRSSDGATTASRTDRVTVTKTTSDDVV